jgi:hypothetical protein
VAVSPRAAPWLAAMGGDVRTCLCGLKAVLSGRFRPAVSEDAAALPTPPSPRLALHAPIPTALSPGSEADHVIVRASCLCLSAPLPLSCRLCRREPLHGERSPEHPLATFFSGYT